MDVRVGLWRKLSAEKLMLFNCGVGEDSWESLGLQGGPASPSYRRSVLGVHWKDWRWSWNSSTLATSSKSWLIGKILMLGGIGGRRRRGGQRMRWLDGITDLIDMSLDNSGSWWWTGRPGVLWFMELQRVGHGWVTDLTWAELRSHQSTDLEN